MTKEINFDDLDDGLVARPAKGGIDKDRVSIVNGGEAGYEQVTCPKCNGRGSKNYGYVNIRSYPCTMCKQTGKVTQRRIKAVEAAKKGFETARHNKAVRTAEFYRDHGDVVDFIERNMDWSDFYRKMRQSITDFGFLTEKQVEAVRRGMAKAAERKAERLANAPVVDVSAIEALFAKQSVKALKWPALLALDGLKISPAGAGSKNAGALYVKENGTYVGKIMGGRFSATREASSKVLPRLLAVAADPVGQAQLYGKETGVCCCCGAELTNKESIELGIGPICRSKWF